eukprot:TRINITY_DN1229_c0_g1_i1.p1 TRINITY_DN1229_c0_g1~~TRINITY_DN1229_c0_g1_i1.p1  ORF type:complete len:638 (+),score=75.50 TRINITY_DN1229_c0_g1_i1:194-2107(+)
MSASSSTPKTPSSSTSKMPSSSTSKTPSSSTSRTPSSSTSRTPSISASSSTSKTPSSSTSRTPSKSASSSTSRTPSICASPFTSRTSSISTSSSISRYPSTSFSRTPSFSASSSISRAASIIASFSTSRNPSTSFSRTPLVSVSSSTSRTQSISASFSTSRNPSTSKTRTPSISISSSDSRAPTISTSGPVINPIIPSITVSASPSGSMSLKTCLPPQVMFDQSDICVCPVEAKFKCFTYGTTPSCNLNVSLCKNENMERIFTLCTSTSITNTPYYCAALSPSNCVATPQECPTQSCPHQTCWTGECAPECPPIPACGGLKKRCESGHCVNANESCDLYNSALVPCDSGKTRCADGLCYTSCPPSFGCGSDKTKPIQCLDMRCVSTIGECTCLDGLYWCHRTKQCVESADMCDVYPLVPIIGVGTTEDISDSTFNTSLSILAVLTNTTESIGSFSVNGSGNSVVYLQISGIPQSDLADVTFYADIHYIVSPVILLEIFGDVQVSQIGFEVKISDHLTDEDIKRTSLVYFDQNGKNIKSNATITIIDTPDRKYIRGTVDASDIGRSLTSVFGFVMDNNDDEIGNEDEEDVPSYAYIIPIVIVGSVALTVIVIGMIIVTVLLIRRKKKLSYITDASSYL